MGLNLKCLYPLQSNLFSFFCIEIRFDFKSINENENIFQKVMEIKKEDVLISLKKQKGK